MIRSGKRHDKRNMILGLCAMACAGLTACGGDANLDLTQEQHEAVVEYAARTLMQYDMAGPKRLVELTEEELLPPEPEHPKEEPEAAGKAEAQDTITYTEGVSISQALGLADLEITFDSYEVCDEYPPAEEGNTQIISLTASGGNKLLVLSFQVENTGSTDAVCDLDKGGVAVVRFRVNGEREHKGLSTLLSNDLYTYDLDVAAGTSEKAVVLLDIPAEQAESIKTLSIHITAEGGSYEIPLQ